MKENDILQAIYRACAIINDDLDTDRQLVFSPDTVLFGSNSVLDSLKLVGLIISIEREIEDACGISLVLTDERAMSQKNSPFRTVQTLSEYIAGLLDETNE
jgi:acyl carrier protein